MKADLIFCSHFFLFKSEAFNLMFLLYVSHTAFMVKTVSTLTLGVLRILKKGSKYEIEKKKNPGHLTWCLMLTLAIFFYYYFFFGTSYPVNIVIFAFAQCNSFSSRLLE